MVTPSNPLPPTNNFCLYPPRVLRCFWKDPLMTPHPSPPHFKHHSLLTPSPSIAPSSPPPKNFDYTQGRGEKRKWTCAFQKADPLKSKINHFLLLSLLEPLMQSNMDANFLGKLWRHKGYWITWKRVQLNKAEGKKLEGLPWSCRSDRFQVDYNFQIYLVLFYKLEACHPSTIVCDTTCTTIFPLV